MKEDIVIDEHGAVYSLQKKTLIEIDKSKFKCKSYHVAEGTVEIEDNLFYCCDCIEELWVPDSVVSGCGCLCEYAKNLRFARLSRNIKYPDIALFNGCVSLEKIILPEGIECIGENMFSGCVSLKHINLPSSIKHFCGDTFCHSGIEEIKLPEGLETIGSDAFVNCRSLKRISIPRSVSEIEPWFVQGHRNFEGVECFSPHFRIEDECLIVNKDDSVIACWTKAEEFHIPSSARKIRSLCNDVIEKIVIDHPLEEICYDALCASPNLKAISVNAEVGKISESYNSEHILIEQK